MEWGGERDYPTGRDRPRTPRVHATAAATSVVCQTRRLWLPMLLPSPLFPTRTRMPYEGRGPPPMGRANQPAPPPPRRRPLPPARQHGRPAFPLPLPTHPPPVASTHRPLPRRAPPRSSHRRSAGPPDSERGGPYLPPLHGPLGRTRAPRYTHRPVHPPVLVTPLSPAPSAPVASPAGRRAPAKRRLPCRPHPPQRGTFLRPRAGAGPRADAHTCMYAPPLYATAKALASPNAPLRSCFASRRTVYAHMYCIPPSSPPTRPSLPPIMGPMGAAPPQR